MKSDIRIPRLFQSRLKVDKWFPSGLPDLTSGRTKKVVRRDLDRMIHALWTVNQPRYFWKHLRTQVSLMSMGNGLGRWKRSIVGGTPRKRPL